MCVLVLVFIQRKPESLEGRKGEINGKTLIYSSGLGELYLPKTFFFCDAYLKLDNSGGVLLRLPPTTMITIILSPSISLHLSIFLCCLADGKLSRAGAMFLFDAYTASSV